MLLLIVDVSNPRFPHMVQQSNSAGMQSTWWQWAMAGSEETVSFSQQHSLLL
jgi:hypothetical protein